MNKAPALYAKSSWALPTYAKLALLLLLLILTNLTFFQGMPLHKFLWLFGLESLAPASTDGGLPQQAQQAGHFRTLLGKLVPLLAVWGATFVGVTYAALDKRLWLRLAAAVLVACSSAFTMMYEKIAGAPLNLLDLIAMWNARHEAGRALGQFQYPALIGAAVGIVTFLLILWPARQNRFTQSATWHKLWIIPVLPMLVYGGLYYRNNGVYPFALPGQYNSATLTTLLAYEVATKDQPERKEVAWTAEQNRSVKHIVLVVDESIRADFLDLQPGNTTTPNLGRLSSQFINFGPAVSGGVCSNYSNALIRFGASRKDLTNSVNSNATIFAYAKKAGYRTVYIDAQAYNNARGHKIQNFMNLQEKGEIDGFNAISSTKVMEADYELNKIIAAELKSDTPVFIYANKNGAHFPYDDSYPADQAVHHPTQTEAGDTVASRLNSYRNSIDWTVDRWMVNLFDIADLSQAVMIYTSDHAQRFEPGKITHCQTDAVDPQTALVPLFVYAPKGSLADRFTAAALQLKYRASHFQIAPTVYELMGYKAADIATAYDESLLSGTTRPAEFTSGDIFGLFGNPVTFSPIDLSKPFPLPTASTQ
jgi:glucan phosphoethanolaminetransferase (alkaline phosphatase superfamily)